MTGETIKQALVNEGYADDIPREKDDCANHHHDTVFAVFDCLRYISIKGSCCRTIGGPYGNTTGFTWNRNGIHIVYPDSGDKER